MITSFKRLIAALAVILPVAALVTSPVMAASHTRTTKTAHHTTMHKASIHKASAHKSIHKKVTAAS